MEKEYQHLEKTASDQSEALDRLAEIIKILRQKCPWDREQTHESLRSCMIEEAYEVAEAIDRDDTANLREELGDVMLQVVFHSELAEEKGRFDLAGVINEECEKMIRRHPHVFNEEGVKDLDKALEKWENIKVKEHRHACHADSLYAVPRALPALVRSYKIQKKAADVGFDWDSADGAIGKIFEELEELKAAENRDERFEEMGDLLFSVVNLARFAGVEPEPALEASSDKFMKRFELMEKMADKAGKNLKDMTLKEMDQLWGMAKKENL